MEPSLTLLLAILMLVVISKADSSSPVSPIEPMHDFLVYPMNRLMVRRKRDTSDSFELERSHQESGDFHKFVEAKLIQHTRALEHLLNVAQANTELTKKLTENLSSYVTQPKLPEKVQLKGRRSMDGRQEPVSSPVVQPQKLSPWCSVAMTCRKTNSPVCGYDDIFGYGKFDDVCHMLQVNCYWRYNFGLVAHCRPILNKKY